MSNRHIQEAKNAIAKSVTNLTALRSRAPSDLGVALLTCRFAGMWSDYRAVLSWKPETGNAQISCSFAVAPLDDRWPEVLKYNQMITRSLYFGKITVSPEKGRACYTDSKCFKDSDALPENLSSLIRSTFAICDSLFYPFFMIAWAGYSAQEALQHLTFNVQGEA